MFCPSCGSEERQPSQYCRACGSDLRPVRATLERPDSITEAAISARQQISHAIADRIREIESADDLKEVAEEVLPQIEKFLDSPEERRLRRIRAGVTTSAIGVGSSIFFLLLLTTKPDADVIPLLASGVGLGVVTFLIGLGFIINAFLFTVPRKELLDRSSEASKQKALDETQSSRSGPQLNTAPTPPLLSVTEHTTKHLTSKL